jgi:hypothetical protein
LDTLVNVRSEWEVLIDGFCVPDPQDMTYLPSLLNTLMSATANATDWCVLMSVQFVCRCHNIPSLLARQLPGRLRERAKNQAEVDPSTSLNQQCRFLKPYTNKVLHHIRFLVVLSKIFQSFSDLASFQYGTSTKGPPDRRAPGSTEHNHDNQQEG